MLKSIEELRAFRAEAKAQLDAENKKIIICGGAGCVSKGANKVYEKLTALMNEKNVKFTVKLEKCHDGDPVRLTKSGCHGFCEVGPLVRIEPQGWLYVKVKPEDCEEILEKTIKNGECVDRLCYTENGVVYKEQKEVPFYKKQTRVSLSNCDKIDATSIEEYLARGGYTAFEKALTSMKTAFLTMCLTT